MSETMIVSDVGGTNGRFAIAEFTDKNKLPVIKSVRVLPCNEYDTFSDMFAAYARQIDDDLPKIAHFAIAGEMTPRQGNLWHFNWDIKADEIEERFGFDHVCLINDFEALIHAIPHLPESDLMTITPFEEGLSNAPFSVFGVGSGFGAAIGVPTTTELQIVPTEVGHISFAPKSDIEIDMLKYFRNQIDHISIETFLSGPGLKRIHDFIVERDGAEKQTMSAAEITSAAKQGNIESCVKTVNLFLSILGSVAGDIALAHGAKSGIYIAGGIIPKISGMITDSNFIQHFNDKPPMVNYVNKVPVKLITSKMPALLGAAMKPRT